MRPINAYKDILDNVVSPITYVSMNHQNQLEQMANGSMFATLFRHSVLTLPLEAKLTLVTISPTIATMELHDLRFGLGVGLLTWFLSTRLLH
jgi:hypothetical protein